jgi:hypothetical protein
MVSSDHRRDLHGTKVAPGVLTGGIRPPIGRVEKASGAGTFYWTNVLVSAQNVPAEQIKRHAGKQIHHYDIE